MCGPTSGKFERFFLFTTILKVSKDLESALESAVHPLAHNRLAHNPLATMIRWPPIRWPPSYQPPHNSQLHPNLLKVHRKSIEIDSPSIPIPLWVVC